MPSSRVGIGPPPPQQLPAGPAASQTDKTCESRGPSRRAQLQRLKGLIVAGGPSAGSCPRRRHRQSPAFVPTHCPCPDLGSAGQRLLSAGGWGLLGEGLPWTLGWLGMGVVSLAQTQKLFSDLALEGAGPWLDSGLGRRCGSWGVN